MTTDSYVIRATRDGEEGYIDIDYQSGGYPGLMSMFCHAAIFSYDAAIKNYNMLTSGCFKNLGFKDCKIYQVTLEPIEYTKYDD